MVASSTEQDYCYGFCHITKINATAGGIKQLSETMAKPIKEDPIKHGLL